MVSVMVVETAGLRWSGAKGVATEVDCGCGFCFLTVIMRLLPLQCMLRKKRGK
jgi:hypothetical protein